MKQASPIDSTFHIYVRTYAGAPLARTETVTSDPLVAEEAIRDLLQRPCFMDQPLVLIALYREFVYMLHEFGSPCSAVPDETHQLLDQWERIDWLRFPVVH